MSVILRHDGAETLVRPLTSPGDVQAAPVSDPAVLALEAKVAALEDEIADSALRHERALRHAVEAATREALENVARDETRALETLDAALAEGAASIERALGALQQLALAVAESALLPILGEGDYSALLQRAIAAQVETVGRALVVAMIVSPLDFADATALASLKEAHTGTRVDVDPTLARGDCRVVLTLGEVDLSIERHWRDIRHTLETLALAGASP